MPKLSIAIRVRTPLDGFLIGAQREAQRVQPLAERLLQLGHAFRRPLDEAHRFAFGVQQDFQIGLQAGIVLLLLFSPSAFASDPLPWGKQVSCLL